MSTSFAETVVSQTLAQGTRRSASIAFLSEIVRRKEAKRPKQESRGVCVDEIGNRHAWRIVIEEAPGELAVKRLCRITLAPYISTVVPVMDSNDEDAMKHAARLFRDLIAAWDLRIETA
jgi:hypothetical protein